MSSKAPTKRTTAEQPVANKNIKQQKTAKSEDYDDLFADADIVAPKKIVTNDANGARLDAADSRGLLARVQHRQDQQAQGDGDRRQRQVQPERSDIG